MKAGVLSTVFLLCLTVHYSASAACASDRLILQLTERINSYTVENFDAEVLPTARQIDGKSISEYRKLQLPDGSWSDVDYASRSREAWAPRTHAYRVLELAAGWRKTSDPVLLGMALKGVDYWIANKPWSPTNTWNNDIGIPDVMGRAFLLLRERMTPEQMNGAVEVMEASVLKGSAQNKIWLAQNVLMRALLEEDVQLVMICRDSILSEFCFTDQEGVQPDFSYHQHGAILQLSTYGLETAGYGHKWAAIFDGTPLAFPKENKDVIYGYARNTLSLLNWNGYTDLNALGRVVYMGAQQKMAEKIDGLLNRMGVSAPEVPVCRYYPCSDFGIYRSTGWYASLRMQSTRLEGCENTNFAYMNNYFVSDGALLMRIHGDEYEDIPGYMSGKRFPGVTSYDNGRPLWGPGDSKMPYNNTDKVYGAVEGEYMVAAMDYDRDGLKARKSWFFWSGGVICLGAGISRSVSEPVVTTVDICRLKGPITKRGRRISHYGKTYIPLDGQKYSVNDTLLTGNWRTVSPDGPDTPVSARFFEMVLEHGNAPSGASYAYAIVPEDARLPGIKVLVNSVDSQIVRIGRDVLRIDWKDDAIYLNDSLICN